MEMKGLTVLLLMLPTLVGDCEPLAVAKADKSDVATINFGECLPGKETCSDSKEVIAWKLKIATFKDCQCLPFVMVDTIKCCYLAI
jgi:hypothetical protein